MKIKNNYDGASIEILKIDGKDNIVILSPKEENNHYSNYYNFIVENDKDIMGKVYIKNLTKLLIHNKKDIPMPKYRSSKNEYKDFDKSKISFDNNELIISIKEHETLEISSYPRYTMDNFYEFIRSKNSININNEVIPEINIGNPNGECIIIIARQHPGETLSSYFIEGIISGIIDNIEKIGENKFIIFPIVNIKGVKNGNHRYVDGIDYNRMWNTDGKIKEIDYIKKRIEENKIKMFIDIHCDELTKKDYIRTNSKKERISGIIVIKNYPKIVRFVRALVKQKKIINLVSKSAREYVEKKYKCESMLVELSLMNIEKRKRYIQGYNFIKEMVEK